MGGKASERTEMRKATAGTWEARRVETRKMGAVEEARVCVCRVSWKEVLGHEQVAPAAKAAAG